jgi:cytochrome bd ubiquinol oxidase subunit I
MILSDIDISTIDWSRAQFALTAIYHWLFVPLTLGLALIMGIMETCYYRTRNVFWKDTAVFWQKLFGINFAMGIATGIILEFEFGTNWSNYSWFVGDIFGAPLAIEGIVAFFMESTFVAIMFFGWKKVSRGFHLASTWLTGAGATISAWWILVANSWMQYPVGQEFNPDTVRNEMVSFAQVALSPVAIDKFFHTVISTWVIGAIFVIAVSCWYLIKGREKKMAIASIKIAAIIGLISSLLAIHTGDNSAYMVAQTQPMKLAAMEALYEGGNGENLTVISCINPFKQPDYSNSKHASGGISIPNLLSLLATHNTNGFVPGVNDILKGGYLMRNGKKTISYDEKISRGKVAIKALGDYRKSKAIGDNEAAQRSVKILKSNIDYFGYGYIKNKGELVPYIPICFYAFRVMVGLGIYFVILFACILFIVYRKDISTMKWIHIIALCSLPLGYIVSESGWLVAEFGRQPWTIQDMLPTCAAISDLHPGAVMTTFFIFLVLFSTLLTVEINIMCKAIKKGPDHSKANITND